MPDAANADEDEGDKMKIYFTILTWIIAGLCITGCNGELLAGGTGLATGLAASETMQGIQKDLAAREAALMARYQEAVESGAQQEVLDKIESQLNNTRYAQESVETTKQALSTDWSDPAAAGGIIGMLGTLAYAFATKKKLVRTETGVNKFIAKNDNVTSKALYDEINSS